MTQYDGFHIYDVPPRHKQDEGWLDTVGTDSVRTLIETGKDSVT
jgi:hypothetical protein